MIEVAPRPEPGVNLVGFLHGELGLGEIARKLAGALERAGVPFSAIAYRRTPSRQEQPLDLPTSSTAPYDINLFCLNADELVPFATHAGPDLFAGRYSIGVWFWETSVFRDTHRAGLFLDEIWAPTDYVRRVVAREVEAPLHVVPIPVEAPSKLTLTRTDLGLPEGFVFLFLFDFVSAGRKNPLAVVEAFRRTFAPGDGPTLVLKSINGTERKPRQLLELRAAAADRPDIRVVDGYVSVAERDAYVGLCDCFVSLHRSEGFGLTMAEAMAYAKPVIATGYSGNTDFMDERTSYLVPYRLVPVPQDWWAYSPGAEWAEPDVGAASALMRHVFEHRDEARAVGARGRDKLLRQFSLERTAGFLLERLDDVRTRLAASPRSAVEDSRVAILQASQHLAKGVGGSLGSDPVRGPVSLLRRGVRNMLWPQLDDQHRFDDSVLDALSRVRRTDRSAR